MKRPVPPLLFFALTPLAVWAGPFAGVSDARDAADGVAVTAVSASAAFAPVTDPRDTMPMAPPLPTAAAPVDDRITETPAVPTPHVDPSATAAPTLPALVKRPIKQEVTEAAPGVLLVQPASTAVEALPTKSVEPPLRTSGTLNGQMFNDRTETLTPNGVVDDQPEPKDGFSFGGGTTPPAAPVQPASAATVPPAMPEVSATEPPSPTIIGPVKIISPISVISPVGVVSAAVVITSTQAAAVSATIPLAQPIAAALTFMADDITLSARLKQQLQTFTSLAKGNVLSNLTLTQRVVAPLNAVNELADARRKIIVEQLKANGVVGGNTRISEVRVRSTAPTSKITLIGN